VLEVHHFYVVFSINEDIKRSGSESLEPKERIGRGATIPAQLPQYFPWYNDPVGVLVSS
jgi:hypothetical protein